MAVCGVGNIAYQGAFKGKKGVRFEVAVMDYLTKWAKVEPLATITAQKIKNFVFRSIICKFGIPYKLTLNNGKQFDCGEMDNLCDGLQIKKSFSAICHPQSNRQTEAVNKILKETIKKNLKEAREIRPKNSHWPSGLTTQLQERTTGVSSFSLTYKCEAMVPSRFK